MREEYNGFPFEYLQILCEYWHNLQKDFKTRAAGNPPRTLGPREIADLKNEAFAITLKLLAHKKDWKILKSSMGSFMADEKRGRKEKHATLLSINVAEIEARERTRNEEEMARQLPAEQYDLYRAGKIGIAENSEIIIFEIEGKE